MQSAQLLHCKVSINGRNLSFLCSVVYAFNVKAERESLWRQMSSQGVVSEPWLVMGDFNTTLKNDERMKSCGFCSGDISELHGFTTTMELFDLSFSGDFYTWCNHQTGENRLWCKLDRALVNTAWICLLPNSTASFLNPGSSDHSPCLVKLDISTNRKPKPFRFCDMWSKHEQFMSIVQEAWQIQVRGCPMFVVVQKLKSVKGQLKGLHRNQFSDLQKKIADARTELETIQAQVAESPFDGNLVNREREMQQNYQKLVKADISLAAQRAKCTWVREMDANSAFFHAKIKERQHRSIIGSITDSTGLQVVQPELIEKEFLMYYQNLFGKAKKDVQSADLAVIQRGRMLTMEEANTLCRPFSEMDVETAVKSIPNGKSPGPDGFTTGFYKTAWPIVKRDVTKAVLNFFESGKLLGQINATNITLVPKTNCPTSVGDYRPISCCNVIYKVISKLLTQRLNEVLDKLVSHNQAAFVSGRSIVSNLLISQDLVRNYHKKGGTPRCLMKIDLSKAYDSVDWGFLEDLLYGLNFHPRFVHWILVCLSTARFSIIINGQPKGYFVGKRGLRQGDPISPYLFVLAMEYLTRKLQELEIDAHFGFHAKCKTMKLTHLIFADDIMLFCKADEESPALMMDKFDEFSRVSGLEINKQKSQIFFGGVRETIRHHILQRIGVSEGQLPVTYLGLPLVTTKLSPVTCQPVVEKVQQRICSWATKLLSYAGRIQLVNSVLFHLQVYWCGALLLPKKVLKNIDSACRNFIWSGKWNQSAMALVAWDDMCTPRCEGGLGIKQLDIWNRAALSKLVWLICNNHDNIWVHWAKQVLLKGKNFWEVEIPTNCAWTWRQILKLRPMLKKFIWVQVGDGRQTSLFYDWWMSESRLSDNLSSSDISTWGHDLLVCNWWNGKEWSIPDSFVRRHPHIAEAISQQSLSQLADVAQWKPAKNGMFSISSCYDKMRSSRGKVDWHSLVWSSCIFPRHSILLWLVVRDRLKTKFLLVQRGLEIDAQCCFCGTKAETCDHLFFDCDFSRSIWREVLVSFGIRRNPCAWSHEWRWIQRTCKGRRVSKRKIRTALAATIYLIWQERNYRIFQGKMRSGTLICREILSFMRLKF
ncbi:hypothetical protein SLA2020_023190 [Shorea laevis]